MKNNKNPFFSIIMPVYNAEAFIDKSIQSVLRQRFGDFELICVNDGTKDNAFKICQKYAADDSRIVCLDSNQNIGQSMTRNRGLQIVRGEYLLFLDSDDALTLNALESIHNVILNSNPDCILFGYKSIYENGKIDENLSSMSEGYYSNLDFYKHILIELNHPFLSCVGTKVYRTSLVKKENILFNPKYLYNEDIGFSLTAYKKCCSFYYIKECFYLYYKRGSGSIMSNYKPNMFECIMRARQLYVDLIDYNKNDNLLYHKQMAQFYNAMLGGAFDSLRNERRFSSKSNFKKEVWKIKNHNLFKACCSFAKTNKKMIQKKKRFFMYAVMHEFCFVLWRFVK